MSVDEQTFYTACDPILELDTSIELNRKYHIDFSPVREEGVIEELRNKIMKKKDNFTHQLYTGQVGCGKSTELKRLAELLNKDEFHVVYLTIELEMEDVEVTDLLLVIAKYIQISMIQSNTTIESKGLFKRFLEGSKNLLDDGLGILKTELESGKIEVPGTGTVSMKENELAFSILGLGKMSVKTKTVPLFAVS